ncbi:putative F-box protein At3g16210 [Vicia villosa]|uniref:putative F-box protein At3g16210 n=1 Tax=Vicia villosa TaxID=3911 RepID=UPI00273CAACF|nr:putative F-box protein At3g16210 [Vicia villosa]
MLEREISPSNATTVQLPHRYIPNDVVLSILSKLSLKSFKRFQSVCKSWSLLFDDPFCMNLYRKSFLAKDSSYYDDKSPILYMLGDHYRHRLYSFSGERFENVALIELPKPFKQSKFEILGSTDVNGIFCLRIRNYGGDEVILWNPTTNEFKKLPSSRQPNYIPLGWGNGYNDHGFYDHFLVGYDHAKNDFKVVQITFHQSSIRVSSWEIYSLNSNSWKKMEGHISPFYMHYNTVYMDGISHWWNRVKTNSSLMSFDFSTESFMMTPMPSYVHDLFACIIQLNGSIALTLHHKETSTFHILILGEVGVQESWTKLFVVGPSPLLKHVIGAGKKGKILFIGKDNELLWFDLSTEMIDEIGAKSLPHGSQLLFYRKSTLPIRGIYN